MKITIKISKELQTELADRKRFSNESYEGIIWDLIEDTMELSEETKKEIELARKQIKEGKVVSLEEIKKEQEIIEQAVKIQRDSRKNRFNELKKARLI